MKTRVKIKEMVLISFGTIILVVACMIFVGCVFFFAIKQPLAFFCALLCGAGFFMVLGDLIEILYELYKERNQKEKDEKVTIKI